MSRRADFAILVASVGLIDFAPAWVSSQPRDWSQEREFMAVVEFARGEVQAQLADGRALPVYSGSWVPKGTTIQTQGDARCVLQMPDGSRITIRSETHIALTAFEKRGHSKRRTSIKILAGRIWARVAKWVGGETSWRVESNNAVAGVRGTEFTVAHLDSESTRVDVTKGVVALSTAEGNVEIPGGFTAEANGLIVSAPRPLPKAPRGLRPVSGSFTGEVSLRWKPVVEAKRYRIEIADDVEFVRVVEQHTTEEHRLTLKLAPGTYYWRTFSVDGAGAESKPSPLFRFDIDR